MLILIFYVLLKLILAAKWNQTDQVKKNGYPQELVKKTVHLHLKNLKRIKTLGPKKCVVTLKIPFINKSSEMLEKKIRQLIRNTYYAAYPRIVFTSKPLLTPGGKDPI